MEVVFGGGPVGAGQISAKDFAALPSSTATALQQGKISVNTALAEVPKEVEKPLAPGTIVTNKLGNLTFLDETGNFPDPFHIYSNNGQTTALDLNVNGKAYTFIPQNILEKGWVKDGKQYFFGNVLVDDNLSQLIDKSELINLAGLEGYEKIASENGISTTGFLIPQKEFRFTREIIDNNIRSYESGVGKGIYTGEIQGISFYGGKPIYVAKPIGKQGKYSTYTSWIQAPDTKDYAGKSVDPEATGEFWSNYWIPGDKPGGLLGLISDVASSDLFKLGSLALGAYGLYNLATAGAAGAGAAGAGAAGTGLTPGAAGVTGLTPGAAGVTGIVAPAGTTLAPGLGATVAGTAGATGGYGLLDTTDFSQIGETGLIPGSAGEGIQVVVPPGGGAATIPGLEAPGLSAMGGAQGITVPIQGGGVVSEMGFVPPGATPSLGDPSSFINNPDYLGSPVISEDYLAVPGQAPAGLSVQDVLKNARLASSLFGQPQQGLLGGYGGGGGQTAGVDYSNLLSLLQGKARTPGVSPLIGPVVDPYQSLLGQPTQYQSLLG